MKGTWVGKQEWREEWQGGHVPSPTWKVLRGAARVKIGVTRLDERHLGALKCVKYARW